MRQPIPFNASITTLIENEELTWEANVPIPGFKPRYIRRLETIEANRTLFINREEFAGWSLPLTNPIISTLEPYFPKTCQALKKRVEG